MPKPVVNNRITYPNLYGRVIEHDMFLNQGVRLEDSPTFANLQLTGNAVINGSLYVYGNTVVMNTNITEFEDNILLLNRLETGPGVTLNQSGIEIDRGTLENYRIVYNESDGTFRSGVLSDLRIIVHKEPTSLNNGIVFWNDALKRVESRDTIDIAIRSSVTAESTSATTGGVCLAGGLGVKGNIYTNGKIVLGNNATTFQNVSGETVITSTGGITFNSTGAMFPYNKKVSFGNSTQSISADAGTKTLSITGDGYIDFSLRSGYSINVPNQIPITFSTQNEKVYTDGSNNMVIAGSQDILLNPGSNKKVLVPETASIAFYNATQRIYGTIAADLMLTAGNDIYLTPGGLKDVKVPVDSGVRFGTSRVSCDSADTLQVTSVGDIKLNPGTSVKIPVETALSFGNSTGETIRADTYGNLNMGAGGSVVVMSSTNSVHPSSGSLVVKGGIGVGRDVCIAGDLQVNGNMTVQGTTVTVDTQTLLVKDNLIVLNNGPSPAADGGILFKRYANGVDNALGQNYAAVFYKESRDLMTFAYTNSDPGAGQVNISEYLGIETKLIRVTDTSDATNVSNGSIQTPGGLAVGKAVVVGDTLFSSAVSTGTVYALNGSIGTLSATNSMFSQTTVQNTVVTSSAVFKDQVTFTKDPVVEGTMYFTNTRPTTTLSSGAMIVSGGVVISNTANAVGAFNGGALNVAGGIWVGGDILVTGSINGVGNASNSYAYLTLTSTDQAVNSTSGSLVTFGGITVMSTASAQSVTNGGGLLVLGGASIVKNVIVGESFTSDSVNTGDLTVDRSFGYNGNGLMDYITQSGWNYLGTLQANEFTEFVLTGNMAQMGFLFAVDNAGMFKPMVTKRGTVASCTVVVYAYLQSYYVFVRTTDVTALHVQVKRGESFTVTYEGNGVNPNGTESGYTGGYTVVYNSSNTDVFTTVTVGSTFIHGDLASSSPITKFGVGSTDTKALLLSKSQVSNDMGTGEIAGDTMNAIVSFVLPAQLAVGSSQVKLPNTASSTDSFYREYWIRAGNQVRQIVGYTGSQRVVQVDIPFTVQPAELDTVYLFNGSYTGLYPNGDVYKIARVDVVDGTIGVVRLCDLSISSAFIQSDLTATGGITVLSTRDTTSLTSGALTVSGGVGIGGGLCVGDVVNVYNDLIFHGTNNSIHLGNYHLAYSTSGLTLFTGTAATLYMATSGGVYCSGLTLEQGTIITPNTQGILGLSGDTFGSVGSRVIVGDRTELFARTTGSVNVGVGTTAKLVVSEDHLDIRCTQYSESSSTGALRVDGGITVRSQQNSVSVTNGGSLTVMGGVSIVKDLFIGGNIYLNGNVQSTGASETPSLTFSGATNCNVIGYSNSSLIYVSNEAMFTFTSSVEATVAYSTCQFEFTVPRRTNTFVNRADISIVCSGYTEPLDVVYGVLGVGVVGSTRGLVKFHSNAATVHYITVMCRYTAS
ncbi:hypothetical protein EB118_05385 [bacterium]|nr:hypothetical protein [bacterium]NDC93769.1 hypothetical protein [bacterium]NDD83102.1 hypothetical protein [bacterium]NDG29517.1 hypothetical protein [bacterium]